MRFASVIGVIALTALSACTPGGPAVEVATQTGPVRFAVELALTEPQQAQGLMYRKELAANRGMLFVFPDDTDRAFWMKNTIIALDMLFIAADGQIVGIREQTTPLSTTPQSVGRPSRYVLEIAGGEAAKQGIRVGDRVTLPSTPHG